mmetsp:Transcript_1528/g.2461  ORF Transcript_1528/g.2461 Transcript_1528/m.2461 type:complete len:388 (-) Transcript_1528:73-1236(-)
MASSAHKTEEEKKEYFDPPEVLEEKVETLAQWIQEASHFIAFTGAGISTSCGIPDFRSGYNTVLPTGPGAWEKRKVQRPSKKNTKVQMSKAIPSPTHMAFVKLVQEGLLKFLVSQNVDGLHRKSGIPPEKLSELHGNTNLEKCKKCTKEYMRDFRVRTSSSVHKHETGRNCDDPRCRGKLKDTIINFGENLDEEILDKAFENAAMADLCLAMGSSLRVTPAADIPEIVSRKGRLVIVNLQKTPLDSKAELTIHAFCDTVMEKLVQKLELDIPQFRLFRRLNVKKYLNDKKQGLYFQGVDVDGLPFSLYKKIEVRHRAKTQELTKEPFKFEAESISGEYTVKLHFQGHYEEPQVTIQLNTSNWEDGTEANFLMVYNPFNKVWEEVSSY